MAHQGWPTTRAVIDEPPRPPSCFVLDSLPFLYNMWVFILLLLHHASCIMLASRRAAVRFGLWVIDG